MIAQKSGPIYIDPETIDSEEDEIVNYPQCKTGQTCSDVVFFDVVNSASFKRCRFSANVQYQSVSAPSFLAFLSLLFESTVGGYIFVTCWFLFSVAGVLHKTKLSFINAYLSNSLSICVINTKRKYKLDLRATYL